MKRIMGPLAAFATAISAPATAQDAQVYQPASVWAADYGEDYCRLTRDFSNGDDLVSLFIERIQPGPMMRISLIGDSIRSFRGADQIGYRMLPSGGPRNVQKLQFETEAGLQFINLGPTTLADFVPPEPGAAPPPPPPYSREEERLLADDITGIRLDRGLAQPMNIHTESLGPVIEALQTCTDELVDYWGLDAEAHKSLSRPVTPNGRTAGWISRNTVPFSEFSKLNGGNNEIRLMIDKSGAPTACHIHWPSLEEQANEKICDQIMENGSFMPALDSAGEPVDSYWFTSVFFLTPPFGGR